MRLTNQSGASKNTAYKRLTDAELVQMALKNEHRIIALSILINRYTKDVQRICFSILHRSYWAKDAVEETFLHMIEQLVPGKYEERAHFPEWIHTIACRCTFKIYAKEKFYCHSPGALHAGDYIPAASPRVPEWDDRFYVLPPWVQRILQKRVIEGKSVKETAAELGIAASTVIRACWMAVKVLGMGKLI